MSATIPTKYDREAVIQDDRVDEWLTLRFRGGDATPQGVLVRRADFLAAVASELNVRIVPADAIVIERSEQSALAPEQVESMTRNVLGIVGRRPLTTDDTERLRAHAVHLLSCAEYLTADPPVEPGLLALTEALKATRKDLDAAYDTPAQIAAKLYAAGVRAPL